MGFYDSSGGKFSSIRFTDGNDGGLQVDKWTSTSSYSAAYLNIPPPLEVKWTWVKLQDNGTNRIYSVSADGNNWIQIFTGKPHGLLHSEFLLHLGRRE